MSNSIDVPLGTSRELEQLLSYDSSSGLELRDWIAHVCSQMLERDLFYGSWAIVYKLIYDGDWGFGVKITSPADDVSAYGKLLPAFMDAARTAWKIFEDNEDAITANDLKFLLPFGLSMARTRSVQLLHFPPLEALSYMDYLYSPTNRRWESLLGYNGYEGSRNSLLERIVDAVPLAAPGGDSEGIAPFNNTFIKYGKQQLRAVLDASGQATQPVVAYGTPVRDWLKQAFGDQIEGELDVLSQVTIQIVEDGPKTPVLCANHPSKFLYFDTETNDPSWAPTVMRQDLIAAAWQVRMAEDWEADPAETLEGATAEWDKRPADVDQIVKAQEREFGFTP